MDSQFHIDKRRELLDKMPNNSLAIISSGLLYTSSNDQNFPYEVERNFFYFTGLEFPGMKLIFIKTQKMTGTCLAIPRRDPFKEKWTGIIPSDDFCRKTSGVAEIIYSDEYDDYIYSLINGGVDKCFLYGDLLKNAAVKSERNVMLASFARRYPFVAIKDLSVLTLPMRAVKNEQEVTQIKKAAHVTKLAIEEMLKFIKPGIKEYEPQAAFEYVVKRNGCSLAFNTIAAGGANAVTLHYMTNNDTLNDGEMLLVDCGAAYGWYNSDVTRTFPINGKFTDRQLEIYNIVLGANKAVVAAIKPGVTMAQLNDTVINYYAAELSRIGLIDKPEEVSRYYYHSVSHSLGLDTHDMLDRKLPLEAGNIITVEPGLYIAQYDLGIRIEDDVLVTENGGEVLTDILREPEEIEEYMDVWEVK